MKKTLCTIISSLSILGAFAQAPVIEPCKYDSLFQKMGAITGSLQDYYKSYISYNSTGQLETEITHQFDDQSMVWEIYKIEYAYQNGKKSSQTASNWNGSSFLPPHYRILYTYDTNGQLETETNQIETGGVWDNYSKMSYAYDANGNITLSLWEEWQNNAWKVSIRTVQTFNATNLLTMNKWQQYSGNTWLTNDSTIYTYNAQGKEIKSERYYISISTTQVAQETTRAYSANGNNSVAIRRSWDENTLSWTNDGKDSFEFDNAGNAIKWMWYEANGSAWVLDRSYDITYDSQGKYTAYTGFYDWNMTSNSFDSKEQGTVYCTNGGVSVKPILVSDNDIHIFPNPVGNNEKLQLIFEQNKGNYTILNHLGQMISSGTLNKGNNAIQLNNLASGIYLLKVENVVKKFMVK